MPLQTFFQPWGQAFLILCALAFAAVFWNVSFLILSWFDKQEWDRFRWRR
jgi:hypothetical protein